MTDPVRSAEVKALFGILRADADASGYGWAIHDDRIMATAMRGVAAIDAARAKLSTAATAQAPTPPPIPTTKPGDVK